MASPKRDRRRADIAKFLDVYRAFEAPEASSAERAIWVVLARHGTREGATGALRALFRQCVDVNEVRVAKGTEIASIIQRHIKNDPLTVAEQIRGFLRRWHKDQHTMDFGKAAEMTPEQAKKYLVNAEGFGREIALALFLHFCALEIAAQSESTEDGKAKKRAERDVTVAANRLRLFSAFSAHGKVTAKSMLTNSARAFARAWAYAPAAGPARPGAKKSAARKKTTAAKPTTAKNATTKKGGGTARPRTTRTTRARTAKKSSRR